MKLFDRLFAYYNASLMKPRFSIIVPTVGRLELWKHALHSAILQDFTNFEIIAINSRPSDESTALINALDDSRIRYITPAPADSHLNWDVGYREARGEYLLWLDDDNYLFPYALSRLEATILSHAPDIVTGNHIHWHERAHPRPDLQNQIVIPLPLFSHAVSVIDGKNYIRGLFGMPLVEPVSRARFHFSETAIRRERIDALMPTIETIDFKGTSPRMMQLVLLATTENIAFIDSPLCIVIQMGDSIAYRWAHTPAHERQPASRFRYSPVTADTYINTVIESLLATKERFPEALAPFDVHWPSFFSSYARELQLLDQDWSAMVASWKELAQAMRDAAVPFDHTFRAACIKAVGITVLRRVQLYDHTRNILKKQESSSKSTRRFTMDSTVLTIEDSAFALPARIEKELGVSYASFAGMNTP